MREPINQLNAMLKKHNNSLTTARTIVFQALQNQEPLSMHELVIACQDKVDRASIYRTIALFEQLGIVQRLQIGWKYKLELSSNFNYHHHHMTCSRCGSVTPLPEDQQLEMRLLSLAEKLQFYPQDHQIEIRGLCEHCRMPSSL